MKELQGRFFFELNIEFRLPGFGVLDCAVVVLGLLKIFSQSLVLKGVT